MRDHWANVLAILSFFWPYLAMIAALGGAAFGYTGMAAFAFTVGMLRIVFRELDHM